MVLAETRSIEFVEIVLDIDQPIDGLSLHQWILLNLLTRLDIDRSGKTQIEKMLNRSPSLPLRSSLSLSRFSYRLQTSVAAQIEIDVVRWISDQLLIDWH